MNITPHVKKIIVTGGVNGTLNRAGISTKSFVNPGDIVNIFFRTRQRNQSAMRIQ